MAKHSHRVSRSNNVRSSRPQFFSAVRSAGRAVFHNPQLSHGWIYLAVFFGGFFGTALRYIFNKLFNPPSGVTGVHWGTLYANVLACFLYAFLVVIIAYIAERHHARTSQTSHIDSANTSIQTQRHIHRRDMRLARKKNGVDSATIVNRGLVMGFCGGLSTMSTFVMELLTNIPLSPYYGIGSVLCGVCAIILGGLCAKSLTYFWSHKSTRRVHTHRRH